MVERPGEFSPYLRRVCLELCTRAVYKPAALNGLMELCVADYVSNMDTFSPVTTLQSIIYLLFWLELGDSEQ